MNRREIGIQADAPFRRRGKYTDDEKEIWMKGRNSGIFMTLSYIVPIPIEEMNKDMIRIVASLLGIPNYSRMSAQELTQSVRDRGVLKAGFKRKQGQRGFELIRFPRE
jgi:hypothetical protein